MVMCVMGMMMEGPKGERFAGYGKGQTSRFTLKNTCETFQTSHLSTFFLKVIAGIVQHLGNKSNITLKLKSLLARTVTREGQAHDLVRVRNLQQKN